MNTEDFIIGWFCRVDDRMLDVKKHPQAALFPSEVVTLALLFALKGVGNRAFYRWLKRDCGHLIPRLPHRTRLFRPFNSSRYLRTNLGGTQIWVQRMIARRRKTLVVCVKCHRAIHAGTHDGRKVS